MKKSDNSISAIKEQKVRAGLPVDFLLRLSEILKPGEYLSHLGALYLTGLVSKLPTCFTVVGNRRRRNRNFGGTEVVFVYHPQQKVQDVKKVTIGGSKLVVASSSMALVDMMTDIAHAPELSTIAELAASIPLSASHALKIAHNISDTVIKRTAYFLAWSGRITHTQVPFLRFRKSPVKLDPRIAEPLAWDNRFHLLIPESFLRRSTTKTPRQISFTVSNWLLMKNSPAFLDAQASIGHIILRRDPEFPILLKKLQFPASISNPGEFGQWGRNFGLFPTPDLSNRKRRNRLRLLLLKTMPACLLRELPQLGKNNAFLNNLNKHEIDFLLSLSLVFDDWQLILNVLKSRGEDILLDSRLRALRNITRDFPENMLWKDPFVGSLIVRACHTHGNFERAEELLKLSDDFNFNKHGKAWIALAKGVSLIHKQNFKDAGRHLKFAQKFWTIKAESYPLALVEVAIGTICLRLCLLKSARRCFKLAWQALRSASHKPSGFSGVILSHLGFTRAKMGHLELAEKLFSRAQKIHRCNGNLMAAGHTIFVQARLLITQGLLSRAKRKLRTYYLIMNHLGTRKEMTEVAALQAYACGIEMNHLGSDAWIKKMPEQTHRDQAFRLLVTGRNHLLRGKFLDARWLLGRALARGQLANIGILFKARASCLHALASSLLEAGPRIPLPEVESVLAKIPNEPESMWFKLIQSLYGVCSDPAHESASALQAIRTYGFFDPLWFLTAENLIISQIPGAEAYVIFQDRQSPVKLRLHARAFLNSRQYWQALQILSRVDSQAQTIGKKHIAATQNNGRPNPIESADSRCLDIDFVSGKISYNGSIIHFRPHTIPAKMLALLLQMHPDPMPSAHAFEIIWGLPMGEEEDTALLKTTVGRVRSLLKSVCQFANIFLSENQNCHQLQLQMPGEWQATLIDYD
jgi:tetratricopeptide (TPR) repeat protein